MLSYTIDVFKVTNPVVCIWTLCRHCLLYPVLIIHRSISSSYKKRFELLSLGELPNLASDALTDEAESMGPKVKEDKN